MSTCRTCVHWDVKYDWVRTDPKCNYRLSCMKLKQVIDIEIDQGSGWDCGGATVETIDTPPDFGCNQWEQAAIKEIP